MSKTIEECIKWNLLFREGEGLMERALDILINGCTDHCSRLNVCKAFFLSKNQESVPRLVAPKNNCDLYAYDLFTAECCICPQHFFCFVFWLLEMACSETFWEKSIEI